MESDYDSVDGCKAGFPRYGGHRLNATSSASRMVCGEWCTFHHSLRHRERQSLRLYKTISLRNWRRSHAEAACSAGHNLLREHRLYDWKNVLDDYSVGDKPTDQLIGSQSGPGKSDVHLLRTEPAVRTAKSYRWRLGDTNS